MDTLRILLTGVGCPGGVTMIRALKDNGEREVHLIGTDARAEAAGRHFCDEFHVVPLGRAEGFAGELIELAREVRADLVFPQITDEVYAIGCVRDRFRYEGIPVIVAGPGPVRRCDNKGNLYKEASKIGVLCPAHRVAFTRHELAEAMYVLGFPKARVCFKPVLAAGSRGFTVVQPGGLEAVMNGLPPRFPEQVVMEHVEGPEHTVDLYCEGGEVLMGFVKTRERVRAGIAYRFEVVDRPDLRSVAERLVAHFGLDGFANVQFIGKTLIEINPRVSTFAHQPDFNMPWLAVRRALGELTADDLREVEKRVRVGWTTLRYWEQVFYGPEEIEHTV